MAEIWRLLTEETTIYPPSPPEQEAALNMAIDEAVVTAYRMGGVEPTLRLYSWKRPALTIGAFQSIQEELDWSICQREEVSVVRRITGGGAILHGQDITYSVIAGPSSSIFTKPGIRGTFFTISHAFLWAFQSLGLTVEVVESPPRKSRTPMCFASPSWYEITCNNRKIVGSAQRRWRNSFLQQGSILMKFNPLDFYRFFLFPDEEQKSKLITSAENQATGLCECAGRLFTFKEVKKALIKGFEQALGIGLRPGSLSTLEREIAQGLTATKYSKDDWNRRRISPSNVRTMRNIFSVRNPRFPPILNEDPTAL